MAKITQKKKQQTIKPQTNLNQNQQQKKLEIGEHLGELKNRFLVWFVCFIIASIIGYVFYQSLLTWLTIPLNSPLFYTSPVGALEAVLGISTLFGFIVSIPMLLYQLIKFLEPAFSKSLRHVYIYILVSMILAIMGVLTAYYLVLPATFEFLAKFAGGQLTALISTQDYFSFITKYLLGFALLFQLPQVIFVISKFVKLKAITLLKYLRHVIVLSYIVGAILTPTPDPVNQTIMAMPIIILYLVSIITLAISNRLNYINQDLRKG